MSKDPAASAASTTDGFSLVDEGPLSTKERRLLGLLRAGYDEQMLRDVLLPFIDQTSPISLRALDWAVVNWSKKHNVVCASRLPGEQTNVYGAYKTTLNFWKRRLFDPFRRRARIPVVIGGVRHETTLGQANFALFAHLTGILAYVLSNIDAIEDDMNRVAQAQKRLNSEARSSGVHRKRKELTPTSSGLCVAYTAPRRVRVR